MQPNLKRLARWYQAAWTDSPDESEQTWRRHARGLMVGWAITASAVVLVQLYPNDSGLSMYGMLLARGLPWQQQWLAAIEVAAPLLMAWHLVGLQRWGQRSFSRH